MMPPVISVLDLETSGLAPPAEVVEVGLCRLRLDDGVWTVGAPTAHLCGISGTIPPEVRAIHHISPAEVAGLPPFDPNTVLEGCVILASHNVAFDSLWLPGVAVPLLCTYKAALRVWPQAPSHGNGALRYWLEDQGLVKLDPALTTPPHRAGPDAYVTAHILKALLETGTTANAMVAWTKDPALLPRCPIGKFRGKPWSEVEAGFLNWMLKQPDMSVDLSYNARQELERRASAVIA